MQVKFKTFSVGSGDCITLLLKNDDKEIHIMGNHLLLHIAR